jgi:hypothetical protein
VCVRVAQVEVGRVGVWHRWRWGVWRRWRWGVGAWAWACVVVLVQELLEGVRFETLQAWRVEHEDAAVRGHRVVAGLPHGRVGEAGEVGDGVGVERLHEEVPSGGGVRSVQLDRRGALRKAERHPTPANSGSDVGERERGGGVGSVNDCLRNHTQEASKGWATTKGSV